MSRIQRILDKADREGAALHTSRLGEPGTAKSWLSEHLAAAISGDSQLRIQGTAGTTEEQIRYSWRQLHEDTGLTTLDLARRTNDFGVAQYFPSHEPWVVPEPMTLEPAETVSRADLDTYAEIIRHVAHEAYEQPETVRTAPHRSTVHYLEPAPMDDPARWAMTWRAWNRKHGGA